MILECLTVGPFQENCYLIGDEKSRVGAIIDPGDEGDLIVKAAERLGLKFKFILNTHAHLDHIGAVDQIKNHFRIPFYLHPSEKPVLESVPMQATMFGLGPMKVPTVDTWYDMTSPLLMGGLNIELIPTPGHTPGGISLLIRDEGILLAGDTLFNGSIGRTDLPGGDFETLLRSIKDSLFLLPDETLVYPGHGPETTIGYEKLHNPFCGTHRGGYFA